jgi:hypothetical protein
MSIVSAFNKILVEFAKNLETTFPEDKDFLVFRMGIENLTKYNSMAGVKLFKVYLTPVEHETKDGKVETVNVKQKILDNDASFFLDEMDYKKKLEETDNVNAFDTITKLKQYWGKLTPQGQAVVMKYLSSLVRISDQISA